MRVLIEAGVDPNSRRSDGETQLLAAMYQGHINATRELLRAGANPLLTMTDELENMGVPLDAAVTNGHAGVVHEVIGRLGIEGCGGASAGLDAFRQAAGYQHLGILFMLTDAGVVGAGEAVIAAAVHGRQASLQYLLRSRIAITLGSTRRLSSSVPAGKHHGSWLLLGRPLLLSPRRVTKVPTGEAEPAWPGKRCRRRTRARGGGGHFEECRRQSIGPPSAEGASSPPAGRGSLCSRSLRALGTSSEYLPLQDLVHCAGKVVYTEGILRLLQVFHRGPSPVTATAATGHRKNIPRGQHARKPKSRGRVAADIKRSGFPRVGHKDVAVMAGQEHTTTAMPCKLRK